VAEDVGQRLVFGPAADPVLDLARLLRAELAGAVLGEQADLDPERGGDQGLGVGARLIATGGGDRALGFLDGLADRRLRRSTGLTLSCHRQASLCLRI
jgi:hypothetical protein